MICYAIYIFNGMKDINYSEVFSERELVQSIKQAMRIDYEHKIWYNGFDARFQLGFWLRNIPAPYINIFFLKCLFKL